MGKKYIIELEEEPFIKHFKNGAWETIYRVKGFNSLVFDWNGLNMLTPYTEPDLDKVKVDAYNDGYDDGHKDGREAEKVRQPDLEQVRKEAYDKGLSDGKNQDAKDFADMYDSGYSEGLKDAWETARKISSMDSSKTRDEIFGLVITSNIFDENTVSEAIEKIRQYEQEKEQSFTTEEVMRQYLDTFCKGRSCTNCLLCTPDFTCGRGKHFLYNCVSDEEVRRAYAAVLAKMKES